jgi:hypothetical protein
MIEERIFPVKFIVAEKNNIEDRVGINANYKY